MGRRALEVTGQRIDVKLQFDADAQPEMHDALRKLSPNNRTRLLYNLIAQGQVCSLATTDHTMRDVLMQSMVEVSKSVRAVANEAKAASEDLELLRRAVAETDQELQQGAPITSKAPRKRHPPDALDLKSDESCSSPAPAANDEESAADAALRMLAGSSALRAPEPD